MQDTGVSISFMHIYRLAESWHAMHMSGVGIEWGLIESFLVRGYMLTFTLINSDFREPRKV